MKSDRERCIELFVGGLPLIVIQSDSDFTPPGKRRVRIVQTTRGHQLRWYVKGRIYRCMAPTPALREVSAEWLKAQRSEACLS